jgi:hypothetical protein
MGLYGRYDPKLIVFRPPSQIIKAAHMCTDIEHATVISHPFKIAAGSFWYSRIDQDTAG